MGGGLREKDGRIQEEILEEALKAYLTPFWCPWGRHGTPGRFECKGDCTSSKVNSKYVQCLKGILKTYGQYSKGREE